MKKASKASLKLKLKKIKLLVLDVDGVLTDGRVFWNGSDFTRFFDVRDGYGIRLALRAGLEVAFLSGGKSRDVQERARHLGIKHAVLGNEEKTAGLTEILRATGLTPADTCYIGDELFDVPVLTKVSFAVAVPTAATQVKAVCDLVTKSQGGRGAVRELIDLILNAQGKMYEPV